MIKKKLNELPPVSPKVSFYSVPSRHAMILMEIKNADVESKKVTLIEIVQQLGEYINDEDPMLRGKAVSFLTSVIKALPPRFLSRQQIQVLTTFFSDRIEDGGAVAGLVHLQGLERFTSEMATVLAQAYVGSSVGNFSEMTYSV